MGLRHSFTTLRHSFTTPSSSSSSSLGLRLPPNTRERRHGGKQQVTESISFDFECLLIVIVPPFSQCSKTATENSSRTPSRLPLITAIYRRRHSSLMKPNPHRKCSIPPFKQQNRIKEIGRLNE